jgi:hypothetical protein
VLALAQPCEAKIVYTPAHVSIGINSMVHLDLNHDGVKDFTFVDKFVTNATGKFGSLSVVPTRRANEAWGYVSRGGQFASALPAGWLIAASTHFHRGADFMAGASTQRGGASYCAKQWGDTPNRYLGLKFSIKGKTHFGWARLSVNCDQGQVTATLTGYAYETVVGKSLRTGQKKDDADEGLTVGQERPSVSNIHHVSEPATLGSLARGAEGLVAWRRR